MCFDPACRQAGISKPFFMETAKPFLIATGNPGKFAEIREVLSGLPYELLSLTDLAGRGFGQAVEQVEETGTTHEENALLKARHFFAKTGWMTLGEDSGLEVDTLQGELGLNTRRWGAGTDASDEEWLEYFLKRMAEFPEEQRTARFVCVAALALPSGRQMEEVIFFGEARGTIVLKPEAPILPGLPLSSVFKPDGFDRVYAALTPHEKSQISHRGLAVGKVRGFLQAQGDTLS